jgi:hypothetical protein
MDSLYPRGAIFVGHTGTGRDRYVVYAGLEIRPAQHRVTGQTVTHGIIPPDALEVAITGSTYHATRDGSRDRRYADMVSGGQNIDDVRAIGSTRAKRIADLWDRWHLNGMRAACVHQAAAAAEIQAAAKMRGYAQDRERWAALSALPCPEGYRYGSAWLYEPVPDDVLAELRHLFGKPDGWTLPM